MGRSLSGHVAWGFLLSDEDGETSEETSALVDEWEERLAEKAGAINPWKSPELAAIEAQRPTLPYTEYRDRADQWVTDHRGELDVWHEVKKSAYSGPADFQYAGVEDYTVWGLVIKDSGTRGYDSITVLDDFTMDVNPRWEQELRDFAKMIDLDLSEAQGPGWLMFLSYG